MDTALAILDTEGLEAVTMRRVATALDTGPASLYAHVGNKGELHELMLERVLGGVRMPEVDPGRWREQLKELCGRQVGALIAHPGLAKIAMEVVVPASQDAFVHAEVLLSLLRAAGVSDERAAIGFEVLTLFCTAFAVEASAVRHGEVSEEELQERAKQMGRYVAALPPDRFPSLLAMGHRLGGGEDRFERALDLIIDGLVA